MLRQNTHSPQHTTSVAAPPEEVWNFGWRWQHKDWAPCHLPRAAQRGTVTSPGEQHSQNPLDYALYVVISVLIGASIRMGHYVEYVKDPRGGWFKMDDLDLTCKRGSVGQSEGLCIPRSSVPFRLKPENSNSHGFELHRPSIKGTKLMLKVLKAIIIIIVSWRY